jgi:hypothetical protein
MAFGLGKLTNIPNKGERFQKVEESKSALDSAGIVSEPPIRSLSLQALGFITRKWRDSAATRRAGLLGERRDHVPVLKQTLSQQ